MYMETQIPEGNPIKKDLRKLLVVVMLVAVIFAAVQYLGVKTSYITDISHNLYKATLENS